MLWEIYIFTLLGILYTLINYTYNYFIKKENLKIELINNFKWFSIISFSIFIILTLISGINVVIGNSFYSIFSQIDEEGNIISLLNLYKSSFLIGILCFVTYKLIKNK
jgi:uncharacterized membrane protein